MKSSLATIFLIGLSIAISGCSSKSEPPRPGSEEFLTRSVYTFYKSYYEAGPSGVMVDATVGERHCYMILTAGHVVKQMAGIFKQSNEACIGFRKKDNIDVIRRISAPANRLRPFFHSEFPKEDIGIFLIPDITGIEKNRGLVCSINLDKPFASGVGIILDKADYAKYSISTGTPVFCLCTDLSRNPENILYDWNSPVTVKRGKITDLSAKVPTAQAGVKMNAIIADFESVDGNSGGPVFAYGNVEGVRYPFLLGVVSGKPGGHTDKCAIAPIGPMVKEIHKQRETGKKVDQQSNCVVLPPTPSPKDIVCETTSHSDFRVVRQGVREIDISMELNAVSNNALRISFGVDNNKNGRLDLEETALQFGWDAGGWMARDYAGEFCEAEPEYNTGRQRLEWKWVLDANGKCSELDCRANSRKIFASLMKCKEFISPKSEWNIIQVKRNGVTDPDEKVVISLKKQGD